MRENKLLLVVEEETFLNTYAFLLNKEGYRVVTATSGIKAMKEFYQQSFDLIVTDFSVKSDNGHTILEAIKEQFPVTPVIVLADRISEAVREFTALMGASALIEKPCSYEMLVSNILRSLKHSRRYQ